jgi:hypothetical protein
MPGTTSGVISITNSSGTGNSAGNFSISVRPAITTQEGEKRVVSDNIGSAFLGVPVSISADGLTAAVGGFQDNGDAGAVWIFTKSNGFWSQQGEKIKPNNAASVGSFGLSLSISANGNTLAVGAPSYFGGVGAVWVFTRSGTTWTQQGSSIGPLNPPGSACSFGSSISISADGNTLVAGAVNDGFGVGAAWVFTRSGSVWTQQGK